MDTCRFILSIFCVLCLSHWTPAAPEVQQANVITQSRAWRYVDHEDGLVGEAWAVCQAQDGAMWFAGKQGVCRYDGVTMRHYDLETTGLTGIGLDISQAQDGTIWVGSEGGVTRFDGESWKTYTVVDGLPGPIVKALCQGQDGTIWAVCGSLRWSPDRLPGGLSM